MSKKSTSWEREVLSAARNFCDQVELQLTAGHHIKVLMTGPKGTRAVIVSSTPGDQRVLRNSVRAFRQVAAEVGVYR